VEAAAAGEERKLVTILFADVTGSTELGEQLDPEHFREVMQA
jgi:class 3 adenylate cyclase